MQFLDSALRDKLLMPFLTIGKNFTVRDYTPQWITLLYVVTLLQKYEQMLFTYFFEVCFAKPDVNVMITIFGDFLRKMTNVMILMIPKHLGQNRHSPLPIIWRKYF
jgi:hypothetical protein